MKTFEQHEAEIKQLKAEVDNAWFYYDRASREISANDEECRHRYNIWRTWQDKYEAALRAKEERRQNFLKLLKA